MQTNQQAQHITQPGRKHCKLIPQTEDLYRSKDLRPGGPEASETQRLPKAFPGPSDDLCRLHPPRLRAVQGFRVQGLGVCAGDLKESAYGRWGVKCATHSTPKIVSLLVLAPLHVEGVFFSLTGLCMVKVMLRPKPQNTKTRNAEK